VMLHRPVYFAATEDLFRQPLLARLLRWFGAFPKRKNATGDVGAMRSIFRLLQNGCLVGIYPEGVRTWDGSNGTIIPGIARLIQKLKVPVYACRTEGSYLAQPRWASRYRRIPLRGVFSRLYAADAIPADEARIVSDIAAAIRNLDYELSVDPALSRRKGLAVNVTRLLYRCPACGTQEGLKIVLPHATNRIECSSCFSSWVVNAASRLAETDENGQPDGDWIPLAEIYARTREMPLVPIRPVARLGLAEDERLFLASRPRFLFKQERFPDIRVFAFGRLFLTSRRLVFRTRLGIPLDTPLASIGSLSVDPGDRMHFTLAGKLYRIPFRNESAMKWFDAIRRLQEQNAAGGTGGVEPPGAAASRGAGRESARPRGGVEPRPRGR